jgi:hypothetical protein
VGPDQYVPEEAEPHCDEKVVGIRQRYAATSSRRTKDSMWYIVSEKQANFKRG